MALEKEGQGPIKLLLPVCAVLCAMAGFQLGAGFAKGLFSAIGPQGAAGLRTAIAAVMLNLVFRPWRNWPANAPWWTVLGLGVSMAMATLAFYMALSRLPQGVTIVLQFLGPLAVALFATRRALDLVWVILALIGVWVLLAPGMAHRGLDSLGVVFALTAAAGWAGYILFGRMAGAAFGGSAPALAMAVAAIIVLPFGVVHAGVALLNPAIWPTVLLVALFSTALPFTLELYAMPRMPARTFAVLMSLEPAFGALSGLFLLHEHLAVLQIVGVVCVIAAAGGATWRAASPVA